MRELSLYVRDFGLVQEAEIRLKPLTILVGENNTGKSYLAQLVYALTRSVGNLGEIPGRYGHPLLYHRKAQRFRYDMRTIRAFERRLPVDWQTSMDSRKNLRFEIRFSDLPQKMKDDCVALVRGELEQVIANLEKELKEAYGVRRISDLNSRLKRGTSFVVRVQNDRPLLSLAFGADKNRLRKTEEVEFSFRGVNLVTNVSEYMNRAVLRSSLSPMDTVKWLMFMTAASSLNSFASVFPANAYYLPAARSGVLQGQRLIARAGLRSLKRAGMSAVSISKLPGVVVDFLDQIYSIDKDLKSDFGKLSKSIENRLTGGAIGITEKKEELPEIYFDSKEMGRFPLHRTSSMVSELAPIILMLRYLVQKGDIVILEEPESHLHPSLQREFAQIIASFVRNGIIVIITTHSDYFVEQLSNIIALSYKPAQVKRKLGYSDSEIIYGSEVGCYRFTHGEDGLSVVRRLQVDKYGIADAGFADVAEDLYDESIEVK